MRAARRARRFALLTLLAIVLVIALLLTAFGSGAAQPLRRLAVVNVAATAQTRPYPQVIAMRGGIRLQMPIPQTHFTAIGYHSASDGALALSPVGRQGNQGLVQRVFHAIFGGGAAQPLRRLAVVNVAATAQTRPYPQVIAMRGAIRLQMPIPQTHFTAIGYHSASDGALALSPVGRQGNQGLVQRVFHAIFGGGGGHPIWYQLDGGATSALDVGAAPGTDVYSPVDGTIVGISPYVVAGHRYGERIDIQPQSSPSLIVSLTQLRGDPSLSVGSDVISGATKIGTVADLARIERQALARYTNDAGNHVSVEIRPASALVLS